MAQSATKERALLGLEPFWGKTNTRTTHEMGPLADHVEVGYHGKRGHFDRLSTPRSPDKVILPLEPIYEDNVENSTSQSERDRRIRNEQLKNSWLNRCQNIELVGILCGENPGSIVITKQSP